MPCVSWDGSAAGKLKANDCNSVFRHNVREYLNRKDAKDCRIRFKENIDPARADLNKYWVNPRWQQPGTMIPDYRRAIHDTMEERCKASSRKPRKIQQNAVLVRSLVIQATPEYFFPKLKGMDQEAQHDIPYSQRGQIDQKAVTSWMSTNIDFLTERFGDDLLSYQIHLDERSPHIHCQVLPITADGRLADSLLFGPKAYDKLHDDLGKANEPLGLTRAPGGSKTFRISVDEYHAREAQKVAAHNAKMAEAEKLAKDQSEDYAPLTRLPNECRSAKLPGPPGILNREEYYNNIVSLQARRDKSTLEYINGLREEIAKLSYYGAKMRERNASLQQEVDELKNENVRLKKVNTRMSRDYKAENSRLRAIPLETVLIDLYGATCIERGQKTVKYSVGDRKIAISQGERGQEFIDDQDPSFKGCGVISLVKAMEDFKKTSAAIGRLKDYFGAAMVAEGIATDTAFIRFVKGLSVPPVNFMPQKSEDTAHAFRLAKERKIDNELMDHLLKTGQIYVDDHKNIVVPRVNGGCFMRGTLKPKPGRKSWKRTIGGVSCGVAELKGANYDSASDPIVCKGITDALALLSRFPESAVMIVGGKTAPDLPSLPDGRKYCIAFDNSEKGNKLFNFYKARYSNVKDMSPDYDFNDWGNMHLKTTGKNDTVMNINVPSYNLSPE